VDDDKAGMYVKPPSGSYALWENTMCNPLGDMRTQTQSAWHDGYASAKMEREWVGLTDEEILQEADKRHARINNNIGNDLLLISFYRAIEAKLKEKNT
jgi:hypothetical protein